MDARHMQMEFEKRIGQFSDPDFPRPYLSHEIEDWLNIGQERMLENLYSDFEKNEKLRTELSPVLRHQAFSSFVTGTSYAHDNGHFVDLPTGCLYPIEERCTVVYTDCNGSTASKEAEVLPVTHDEYKQNKNNPYLKPHDSRLWRMDFSTGGTDIYKRHELITDGTFKISTYNLRYIKRLQDINIKDNVSCELDNSVHDEIVDIAVGLAVRSRPQVQQVEQKEAS